MREAVSSDPDYRFARFLGGAIAFVILAVILGGFLFLPR